MTHSLFAASSQLGPLIMLSGIIAEDEAGGIIGTDVQTQTRAVLARADALLRDAGSSLAQAASVFIHLARASDFAAMNAAYAEHWPSAPPARTTIVCGLRRPDALVEMVVTAVPAGAPRAVVHPDGWMTSPNPYSYGILAGDTLLVSGLVARNGRDNSVAPGDIGAQTRAVLENGREILGAAGLSLRDVVSARVFITEAANFGGMNDAYRAAFPQDPPARATVVTPLTNPNFLVEITLIAVRDAAKRARPFEGLALPLSAAVETTERLFISGALDESGAPDAAGQTRGMIAEIEEILALTQRSWPDVREAIVYVTDMTQQDAVSAELRRVLGVPAPTGIFIETALVRPGALVEMMVTARR
jgi:2-iminobutanoate/2-iminopropanoate deaminase